MSTFARVLLPEPLGPMSAWISPARMSRSSPARIGLSPMPACRSLTFR